MQPAQAGGGADHSQEAKQPVPEAQPPKPVDNGTAGNGDG